MVARCECRLWAVGTPSPGDPPADLLCVGCIVVGSLWHKTGSAPSSGTTDAADQTGLFAGGSREPPESARPVASRHLVRVSETFGSVRPWHNAYRHGTSIGGASTDVDVHRTGPAALRTTTLVPVLAYTVMSPTPVTGVGGSDTAIAFGCAPGTMREHYLSPDEEAIANDPTRKGLAAFRYKSFARKHLVECRRGDSNSHVHYGH
jgi:hypothetical protein